jgi:undecaprenyl phosphate N,N'-diacetylbacillosamine 1-phosphate transferase
MSKQNKKIYAKYFKRPLDLILSILALIVLSPLLLIIAILVRINLGKPIIFKQQRPGLNEKIFTLYKFRTMTNKKNKNNDLLPDEERLTKFGKWLRSTSIDELPELINIIKGDMSIVGPRPLLVEYLPLYNVKQKQRHLVRPGITGLAQIRGRNLISWEKRFSIDLEYLENLSLINDLKILFKTFQIVIKKKGITMESGKIMDGFRGTYIKD